ncbi:hypothetical protein FCM35_KLT15996 [Carex littledalei]|uniref:DUF7610 domain-containing protein n=1 Tax=Carex littledalei TaxID=544730 RepID=A0A833R8H9_9POAL|nr:hypothetical protein FCM35_KLT15996 [Carex littledalei]
MERPHRVLDKKLHQLEMQFNDLFFPPANSMNPCMKAASQERLSKEIEAKVDFLKNLLSIEKECHLHGNAPSHLVKLEERLEGLDTALHNWMEGGDFLKKHVPGEFSMCSCTRSCFSSEDEDGEKEEEEVKEEEKEKDVEEEGSGVAESECFELETHEEDTRVSEVKRFDEGKIEGGDEMEPQGYYRPYLCRLSRIVTLVGAAVAVVVAVTIVISEIYGGFQDDVFLVPT